MFAKTPSCRVAGARINSVEPDNIPPTTYTLLSVSCTPTATPTLSAKSPSRLEHQLRPQTYTDDHTNPRTHARKSSEDAQILLRLLRCLPHARLDERPKGAQQRPKPPSQRRRLLPTNRSREGTGCHRRHHEFVRGRGTEHASAATTVRGSRRRTTRLLWATSSRHARLWRASSRYADLKSTVVVERLH